MILALIIVASLAATVLGWWWILWSYDPSPNDKPRYDFDENHPESDHEKQWRNE